jgi:lipopolysaccharide transport system permease protein
MIMPLSVITSNFLKLLIQLGFLFILVLYYKFFTAYTVSFSWATLGFRSLIFLVGIQALGLGLACSIITAKYRDLMNVYQHC